MKKILIATGGTGGHIYPALATAAALRCRGCEVVFIGVFGASSEKIKEQGFACISITPKGFVSKGALDRAKAAFAMAEAVFKCLGVVRRLKPLAVLGFGGYSSFPTVMAALLCGVPSMLHEQNAVPGKANAFLAKCVRRVAVGFKDALPFFPQDKVVWTGNPVRPPCVTVGREDACRGLGISSAKQTVLVFGGSQGARVFNDEVPEVFAGIPQGLGVQVIHITGNNDLQRVKERYRVLGVEALVAPYMDRIALAYAAADLVIGRAGAGTVTELGLWGIPAILIPYPGAGDHQKYNAAVLERLGSASIIEEKSLRRDVLRDKIFLALKSSTSREEARERSKADFVPDGAERLCDELLRQAYD